MTQPTLLQTPPLLKGLRLLGALFFLLTLGILLWLGWRSGLEAARLMLQAGWGGVVGARGEGAFLLRCNLSSTTSCPSAFGEVWRRRFPWDGARLVLVLGFFLSTLPFLISPRRAMKLPGLARWAERKDMKDLNTPQGSGWYGLLGEVRGFDLKRVQWHGPVRIPKERRYTHTLIVAKPGGGKTTGYYLPNLLLDAKEGWSAIVFDLKWPDREGLMEAMSYYRYFNRPVCAFTPFGESTYSIPLLEGCEDSLKALDLAETIVPWEGEGEEAFYTNQERLLLRGLLMATAKEGSYALSRVVDLLRNVDELQAYVELRSWLRAELGGIFKMRRDVVEGVVAGLRGKLALFEDPRLDVATRPGMSIPWEQFFGVASPQGEHRGAGLLYLGIPEETLQGGRGEILLRLLKRYLDRKILEVANANGGKLPVPLSFYLDELPAFGRLPGLQKNLATLRSRGVALHLAVQVSADPRRGELYGDRGFEAIEGLCGQRIYIPASLSDEDRARLERALGYVTVVGQSRSRSRTLLLSQEGEGEREERRPLLSREEMQAMGKSVGVLFIEGRSPALVKLQGIWHREHPLRPLWLKAREGGHETQLTGRGEHQDGGGLGSHPAYLAALLDRYPPFQRFYEGKTTLGIRLALPEGFPPPNPARVREGVWEVKGGEVHLTRSGLEALGEEEEAVVLWCRLMEWARRHAHYPPGPTLRLPLEEAKRVLLGEEVWEREGDEALVPTLFSKLSARLRARRPRECAP